MANAMRIGAAIIVILIAVIAAVLFVSHGVPSGNATTTISSFGAQAATPVLLTDPPTVPTGTTSLIVEYASLRVHTANGWVSSSGNGTLDLLSLVNVSQVIGSANLPSNATVDMVSFNVTSATITVNGNTSSVIIPNHAVTAKVFGSSKFNVSSGVLLDFTPSVVAIYTVNSTVFVMVPSVRAIVVGSAHLHTGIRSNLSAHDKGELEQARANVSVISSSLSVNGNRTSLSVTVKDNSNGSVVLRHILVYGDYNVTLKSFNANTQIDVGNDGMIIDHGSINITVGSHDGESANASIAANASGEEASLVGMGRFIQHIGVFNFLIASNGTMELPASSDGFEGQSSGYNLTAGSTTTFTFNGVLSYGNGRITIIPEAGKVYRLHVAGEDGASAESNATAS